MMRDEPPLEPAEFGGPVVEALLAERSRFVGFLVRRTGDPDLAEDLLQTAMLRAIRSADTLRDEERVVAWIYRVLRNVLADHGRRTQAEARLAERAAPDDAHAPEPELEAEICRCVGALLDTLRADHAEIVRLVDLEDVSPSDAAGRLGVSPGAARVRLHRARAALRRRVEEMCRTCARHGCLDCTCGTPPPGGL